MKAAFDPLRLNVEALAKAGETLAGVWPLDTLPRLAASAHPQAATPGSVDVSWRAQGEARAARASEPQVWLHVTAEASVGLECQRCLQAVQTPLTAQRSFMFVRGEEAAAELDADLDDDVLALARSLDLRELIEDELLLALPLVPRHEGACPQPLPVRQDDPLEEEKAPNPFAALAALKRGQLPN